MTAINQAVSAVLAEPLKIDIGCGKNKQAGFIGIDQFPMAGVDIVADLRKPLWRFESVPESVRARIGESDRATIDNPGAYFFADNSVDQAHCSHFLEHLTNFEERWERVKFFNELHRILKPGAQCQIIIPHWCSPRYYGDPTHKEPFSEWGFLYLNRDWRMANAPHADISVNSNGYSCDFDWTYGYSLHQAILPRNAEYQQHALMFWKDAAQDILSTVTKRQPPAG